ncbi:MAG: FAD:protein FMN transferase [Eggerthellaceae bacterium]|nr:FAD:protein FMN transferase [Eggerthellaceae bacterium]
MDLKTRTFKAFNTINSVSVCGVPNGCAESALDAVVERCAYYERLFSHTHPESSLVRVNQAGGAPVKVEPDLADLVRASLEYCAASEGLFDITMGPVVALWDFHQAKGHTGNGGAGLPAGAPSGTDGGALHGSGAAIPSADALAAACAHVDWRGVHVKGRTIQLDDPQATLVLGGVAKGYIADGLVALLQERDVCHGVVNLGGNAVVFGGKPDGSLWNVGLRAPRSSAQAEEQSFAVVQLASGSVVTSGIYERCFTAPDGTLFHHILDPHTGMPAETDLASVSLISDRSLDGDGYTTALVAMGLQRALAFVEELLGCEAVFVTRDNLVYATKGIGTEVPFDLLV